MSLAGCSDDASKVAWPAYSDGYSAGAEYSGASRQTRDYCRGVAAERYGDADSREGIPFVHGCGEAANGLPKANEEEIEAAYADLSTD